MLLLRVLGNPTLYLVTPGRRGCKKVLRAKMAMMSCWAQVSVQMMARLAWSPQGLLRGLNVMLILQSVHAAVRISLIIIILLVIALVAIVTFGTLAFAASTITAASPTFATSATLATTAILVLTLVRFAFALAAVALVALAMVVVFSIRLILGACRAVRCLVPFRTTLAAIAWITFTFARSFVRFFVIILLVAAGVFLVVVPPTRIPILFLIVVPLPLVVVVAVILP